MKKQRTNKSANFTKMNFAHLKKYEQVRDDELLFLADCQEHTFSDDSTENEAEVPNSPQRAQPDRTMEINPETRENKDFHINSEGAFGIYSNPL